MKRNLGKSNKREFIIEPGFLIMTGHIPNFLKLISGKCKNPVLLLPKDAPFLKEVDGIYTVERVLPNAYGHLLIPSRKLVYPFSRLVNSLSLIPPRKFTRKVRTGIERFVWITTNFLSTLNVLKNMDSKYKITGYDRIYLPNGDFVTSLAVIFWILRKQKEASPALSIRFINVLENYSLPIFLNKGFVFRSIDYVRRKGKKIFVSAETERYRDQITSFLEDVHVCPYPVEDGFAGNLKSYSKKRNRKVVIGILGSARWDKGFSSIPQILDACWQQDLKRSYTLLVQEASESWGYDYDYAKYLILKSKNCELLPGYLTFGQLLSNLKMCDVILMPYDVATYKLRGSAMLFDAMSLGKPVIGPSNTGFGETIRKYGIGWTYGNFSEIPEIIDQISQKTIDQISNNIQNYNQIRNNQFDNFLNS